MRAIPHSCPPARALRRALATVLLTAVLLGKVLVPGGWMPVQTPRGIELALCSGEAPLHLWLDDAGKVHTGKQPSGHQDTAKDPCPYGALNAAVHLADGPVLGPPPPTSTPAAPRLAATVSIWRGLAAPPPPATGPPLSA